MFYYCDTLQLTLLRLVRELHLLMSVAGVCICVCMCVRVCVCVCVSVCEWKVRQCTHPVLLTSFPSLHLNSFFLCVCVSCSYKETEGGMRATDVENNYQRLGIRHVVIPETNLSKLCVVLEPVYV